MKKLKNFLIYISAFTFLVSVSSCSKKESTNYFSENMDLNIQEIEVKEKNTEKTLIHYNNGDNKVICVLMGYGFSSGPTHDRILKMLTEKFGLAEEGGLIVPVIFPDDLRNRIMNLTDYDSEMNLGGIILLGAPENTHYTIARIQDNWEQNCPFEVFSFFPQDDILGQEATCTFVLDNEQPVHDSEPLIEQELVISRDFDIILENAVKYMISLPGNLSHDKTLEEHIKNITGEYSFKHYTDSETGLQASNHFVLTGEKNKK